MGDRFVGSLCSSSPRRVLLMPVRAASLRCGTSFRSIMHRMSGTKSRRIVSSSGSSTNYDPAVARDDISPRTSPLGDKANRSEEHTSELQSLMRISYAVFCLQTQKQHQQTQQT